MARAKKEIFGKNPLLDLSPMIDLVFLLLIFFMIVSVQITYRKDERIEVPTASAGKVPEQVIDRIIINVDDDGTIRNELGTETYTTDQVEQLMAAAKQQNPKIRLHLRADKKAQHKLVKDVIDASARGGVSDIVFSTYQIQR